MLEKDGDDQLERSCESEVVLRRVKEERSIPHTIKGEKVTGLVTSCVGTAF